MGRVLGVIITAIVCSCIAAFIIGFVIGMSVQPVGDWKHMADDYRDRMVEYQHMPVATIHYENGTIVVDQISYWVNATIIGNDAYVTLPYDDNETTVLVAGDIHAVVYNVSLDGIKTYESGVLENYNITWGVGNETYRKTYARFVPWDYRSIDEIPESEILFSDTFDNTECKCSYCNWNWSV